MDTLIGKSFQGDRLVIDNKNFVNCTLTDCTLEYHGDHVSFHATRLNRCRYMFFGPAQRTLLFLQETGLMPFDPSEWGDAQGRTVQDVAGEDEAPEAGIAEAKPAEDGAGQGGARQDGAGQDGAGQDGAGHDGTMKDGSGEDGSSS